VITFVEVRSLQEKPISPKTFVATVKRLTRKTGTTHVLFALRHDKWAGQPDAAGYLDYFVKVAKWTCLGIALTGVGRSSRAYRAYHMKAFRVRSPNLPFDAPNMIARQMRLRWQIN